MAISHRQAHYHPNLDEPCAHTGDRWQDDLPLAELPDGRLWRDDDRLGWPDWLIVLCEAGVLLCVFAIVYAAIAIAGPR